MFNFDAKGLFSKRLKSHLKELSRYLNYIFNGHSAFALLFFISALAYYYKSWIETLPPNFPGALIIGGVLGLALSWSPVRTLLREADLVFLLAAEGKLKPYFLRTLVYSFISQLYIVIVCAAALGPLYFAGRPEESGRSYLLLVLVMIIFKAWNLFASWRVQKIRSNSYRNLEWMIRLVLNVLVFWMLAQGDMIFAGIATLLFAALVFGDTVWAKRESGLYWERLVDNERQGMQAFYRFANLFTDVPHLKDRVKRRNWLVALFNHIPFKQESSFDYLYLRTVARSGDYFGMYVRLIVLGGVAIWFVPNLIMKLLFALLFLYMAIFQLVPLYKHHRTVLWLDLYPVQETVRRKSVLDLLFRMAILQIILFTIIFAIQGLLLGTLIMLAGGLLFSYLFIYKYAKTKMN